MKVIDGNGYVHFICDECLKYIHNIDDVVGQVQENVRINKETLSLYKHNFDQSLKIHEQELKDLREAIEK